MHPIIHPRNGILIKDKTQRKKNPISPCEGINNIFFKFKGLAEERTI